ncbi:uncharacterized protein LTR77_008602 [Saxophila tyrrhenica]|uniref:Srp40 C-terminal domain-containing protein n=1 Tax=Saxophila tyrrhenica TaxID=1690608 RepID=A0AAV9P1U3_9PEZI|nr:hypothetical protein LTR77_008602 [Saxophila tyrrhenica]
MSSTSKKRAAPSVTSSSSSQSSRSTASSNYSLSRLPPTDPERRLNAADVRRQVSNAPTVSRAKRDAKKIWNRSGPVKQNFPSPHKFHNQERLVLSSPPPWLEQVIAPKGRDHRQGDPKGRARGVFNKSDKSTVDVAYHEKDLSAGDTGFVKADYRSKVPSVHGKSKKNKKQKTS